MSRWNLKNRNIETLFQKWLLDYHKMNLYIYFIYLYYIIYICIYIYIYLFQYVNEISLLLLSIFQQAKNKRKNVFHAGNVWKTSNVMQASQELISLNYRGWLEQHGPCYNTNMRQSLSNTRASFSNSRPSF